MKLHTHTVAFVIDKASRCEVKGLRLLFALLYLCVNLGAVCAADRPPDRYQSGPT